MEAANVKSLFELYTFTTNGEVPMETFSFITADNMHVSLEPASILPLNPTTTPVVRSTRILLHEYETKMTVSWLGLFLMVQSIKLEQCVVSHWGSFDIEINYRDACMEYERNCVILQCERRDPLYVIFCLGVKHLYLTTMRHLTQRCQYKMDTIFQTTYSK